ncbi:hypothetical protein [Phenylobacterium koreense]|uniref:Uncharacterized protein n=1 Tax=Phenylobacterium koreense TaxID=266125 RepID=A0ABV2EM99_9CAUL
MLGDHERRTTRDFSILQELIVELARALFLRLPDAPADNDPLMQVAAQARIERLLSVAAGKIIAGGSQASFRPDRASSPSSVLPPVNSPAAP